MTPSILVALSIHLKHCACLQSAPESEIPTGGIYAHVMEPSSVVHSQQSEVAVLDNLKSRVIVVYSENSKRQTQGACPEPCHKNKPPQMEANAMTSSLGLWPRSLCGNLNATGGTKYSL